MFNKILIALGIRKKVVPDTPARRNTDKVDSPESEITEAYASGRLPRRTARTFAGNGHLYIGGKQVQPSPMPSHFPPKAPPPSKAVMSNDYVIPLTGTHLELYMFGSENYPRPHADHFRITADDIHAKGGEFSGAGASGSWDSPSTSSSDTSSSSSDSGSSSCGEFSGAGASGSWDSPSTSSSDTSSSSSDSGSSSCGE